MDAGPKLIECKRRFKCEFFYQIRVFMKHIFLLIFLYFKFAKRILKMNGIFWVHLYECCHGSDGSLRVLFIVFLHENFYWVLYALQILYIMFSQTPSLPCFWENQAPIRPRICPAAHFFFTPPFELCGLVFGKLATLNIADRRFFPVLGNFRTFYGG